MSVRTLVKSIQDIMRTDAGINGDAQRIEQLCWMFFLKIIDDQDAELELMREGYASPIPENYRWSEWAADPEGRTGVELLDFIDDELFPALKDLQSAGPAGARRRVVREVFQDAHNYMKSGQLMRQVVNKINGVDFKNLSERQHFGDIYEQVLKDLQSNKHSGEFYTPRAVTAFMADRIDPKPGETLLDPACGTGGFLTCALRHMRDRYVKRPEDEQTMQKALRAFEKKPFPHMLCVTNMLLHDIEVPDFVRHDNILSKSLTTGWSQSDRVDVVLTNPPFGGKEEDGIERNFPQSFRTKETADLFLALIVRLLKPGGRAAVVLPDGSLFGEGVKTRLKEHLMEECNLHTIVRLPNSVFRPYASIGTNLLFFEKGEPTREIWFYEHLVPEGQKAYSMTRPIRFEHLQPCIDWWGGPKREGREVTERAWKVTAEEVEARGYNLDFKNPHTDEADHGDPEELLEELDAAEAETAALREQLKTALTEAARAKNAVRLLAQFERVADAPDAIPRLRRLILDLAVRGKLVEQDSTEGNSSELLATIQAAWKDRLAKGEIKKIKKWPSATRLDVPFVVPQNWGLVRLGEAIDLINGRAFKPTDWTPTGLPIVRIQNLNNAQASFNRFDGEVKDKFLIDSGDFLISWSGTPGTSFGAHIWDRGPAILNQHIYNSILIGNVFDKYFLKLAINSRLIELIEQAHGGVGLQHITKPKLEAIVLTLPPLAEQHRIVAKVDELMGLCDQLEASLTTGEETRSRLLDALLAEAIGA